MNKDETVWHSNIPRRFQRPKILARKGYDNVSHYADSNLPSSCSSKYSHLDRRDPYPDTVEY